MNESLGELHTLVDLVTEGTVLSKGTKVEEFEVIDLIKKGGMGEVYRARRVSGGQVFAVKVLSSSSSRSSINKIRFDVESRVTSHLNHPNIIRSFSSGQLGDRPYMVMELIYSKAGYHSLEDLMKGRKAPLDQSLIHIIIEQLIDAVKYMHTYRNSGIIHRDLKPDNILINEQFEIKVADFGLVKFNDSNLMEQFSNENSEPIEELSLGDLNTLFSTGNSELDLTRAGAVLGTYNYMAPEIQRGEEATFQSDIYALGAIFYKMLTGQEAIGRFKLPSHYIENDDWDDLIEKCLEVHKEDRCSSIFEVQEMCQEIFLLQEKRRIAIERQRKTKELEIERQRIAQEFEDYIAPLREDRKNNSNEKIAFTEVEKSSSIKAESERPIELNFFSRLGLSFLMMALSLLFFGSPLVLFGWVISIEFGFPVESVCKGIIIVTAPMMWIFCFFKPPQL